MMQPTRRKATCPQRVPRALVQTLGHNIQKNKSHILTNRFKMKFLEYRLVRYQIISYHCTVGRAGGP